MSEKSDYILELENNELVVRFALNGGWEGNAESFLDFIERAGQPFGFYLIRKVIEGDEIKSKVNL